MFTSVESYLRRGQRILGRWLMLPWVRSLAMALACSGGGFLCSAGSLLRHAQPIALGLIVSLPGWQAVAAGLGAGAGYWVFWQNAGLQGVVWAAAGALLGGLLGSSVRSRDQPLMVPAIAAFLTAITGLAFQVFLADTTPLGVYLLRTAMAFFAALVFTQAFSRRSDGVDWLVGCLLCLTLAQTGVVPWLNPGICLAGWICTTASLPGAVLAGLGLDLAGVTGGSMTAALAMGWLLRLLPLEKRWHRYLLPGAAWVILSLLGGSGAWQPVPALLLGGFAGYFTPPRPESPPRRGQTAAAQVRLELAAKVMGTTQQLLSQGQAPPIDEEAILHRARQRACGGCSCRHSCRATDTLTVAHLHDPLDVDCRKQGRLIPELRRGQEQLRLLQADHRRQGEYRGALTQQYRFLGEYLRNLSDSLPCRESPAKACYRVEAGVRTLGREKANGDRVLAFSAPGCRYYLLLCDGMGTGLAAAQAGQTAGEYLKELLRAGFPPEHALSCLNSLLALNGAAGAVTVDMVELRLDTGYAKLYKWGAVASWLVKGEKAEKIGTASPPPGLALEEAREKVEKLSLRRGEMLILLSDGVDGEEISRQAGQQSQGPPGELAARLLRAGYRRPADDATVAVIRLTPVHP